MNHSVLLMLHFFLHLYKFNDSFSGMSGYICLYLNTNVSAVQLLIGCIIRVDLDSILEQIVNQLDKILSF